MDVSPIPSAQPRRSLRWWIVGAVIAAGLVSLMLCAIVSLGALSLLGKRVEPSVVTATDGQSQVTVPSGWSVSTELNDQAEIQVGNARREQYLIVLTENKDDFVDTELADYTAIVLESFVENTAIDASPTPTSITINGRPALQYEIRGTVDHLRVVYWLTTVEGTQNYYQLLAWTLASKAEQNEPVLQEVVQSFEEVTP